MESKNTLVIVVLVVLIVIAGVQAYELISLKNDLNENGVKYSSSSVSSKSSTNNNALPSNVQNLPQMVGGC